MKRLNHTVALLPLLASLAGCDTMAVYKGEAAASARGGRNEQDIKAEGGKQATLAQQHGVLQKSADENTAKIQSVNERIESASKTLVNVNDSLKAAIAGAKLSAQQQSDLRREQNDLAGELDSIRLRDKTDLARKAPPDPAVEAEKRKQLESLQSRAAELDRKVKALTKAAAGG
jgi:hypothetical protein